MQQANPMLDDLDGLIGLEAQQVPAFTANEYLQQDKSAHTSHSGTLYPLASLRHQNNQK